MLLRYAIGDTLRRARTQQHRTLREVSVAASVSLGYLSEVERGRKEASSELLASICQALELDLSDVLETASAALRRNAPQVVAASLRGNATKGADFSCQHRELVDAVR